jgi:hypothetical protein
MLLLFPENQDPAHATGRIIWDLCVVQLVSAWGKPLALFD